jgi:hypothetical protein
MANPTLERNATSSAPRAGARIVSDSRGAAGVVRSTLRSAEERYRRVHVSLLDCEP